jgi:type IV pilus assembly protein PilX
MKTRAFPHQRGASLLVSLVFLVVMAMIGITVANVTSMEERMAGHTRDRDLALQAAEAALRDAERRLSQDAAFRNTDFPDVLPDVNPNDAVYWEECFTSGAGACAVKYTPTVELPKPGSPGALAAQPEYVVEEIMIGTTEVFRITARAVGGSPDTVVILQSEVSL